MSEPSGTRERLLRQHRYELLEPGEAVGRRRARTSLPTSADHLERAQGLHSRGSKVGAHGVALPQYLEAGGRLVVSGGDLYWSGVDVAVEGPTVTWNLDRKLIGDPDGLALGVIAGVERDAATEEEYDVFPDEGEPLALYMFTAPSR